MSGEARWRQERAALEPDGRARLVAHRRGVVRRLTRPLFASGRSRRAAPDKLLRADAIAGGDAPRAAGGRFLPPLPSPCGKGGKGGAE